MSSRTFGGFVQFREETIVLIPSDFPSQQGWRLALSARTKQQAMRD
jgi:hypothetical protein